MAAKTPDGAKEVVRTYKFRRMGCGDATIMHQNQCAKSFVAMMHGQIKMTAEPVPGAICGGYDYTFVVPQRLDAKCKNFLDAVFMLDPIENEHMPVLDHSAAFSVCEAGRGYVQGPPWQCPHCDVFNVPPKDACFSCGRNPVRVDDGARAKAPV